LLRADLNVSHFTFGIAHYTSHTERVGLGGRDPWFDRLTTLSEVEGVSSKLLLSLDSPPQADFATSGMTDLVIARKLLNFSAACSCLMFFMV
jgi:hypothetical protein